MKRRRKEIEDEAGHIDVVAQATAHLGIPFPSICPIFTKQHLPPFHGVSMEGALTAVQKQI